MQICLLRPGTSQKEGPFTVEQINASLAAREYRDEDFWVWYDGLKGWIPLYSVPGIGKAAVSQLSQSGMIACEKCGKQIPETEIVKVGKWRVCKSCDSAADQKLDQMFRSKTIIR